MADYWNDDENDDDEQHQGDGPADLRKAHRAATRKLKELEKVLAERDEALSQLTKQVRGSSISEVLQAKGVNPKVAKLIPDDVEPNPESVTKWLDEWADVFNITVPDSADTDNDGGASQAGETPEGSGVSAEDIKAFQAALGASDGGTAVPTGQVSKLLSDVETNAQSFDDVLKIMHNHGITTVEGYE